jgi:hypothetical protein
LQREAHRYCERGQHDENANTPASHRQGTNWHAATDGTRGGPSTAHTYWRWRADSQRMWWQREACHAACPLARACVCPVELVSSSTSPTRPGGRAIKLPAHLQLPVTRTGLRTSAGPWLSSVMA